MSLMMFLRVFYFIQVKELKMWLPTKDGHFSPKEIFKDIY
jgi:hypothetical protein